MKLLEMKRAIFLMVTFLVTAIPADAGNTLAVPQAGGYIYKNISLSVTIWIDGSTSTASGIFSLRFRKEGNGYTDRQIGQALIFEFPNRRPVFLLVGKQTQWDFPDVFLFGCNIKTHGIGTDELLQRISGFSGDCKVPAKQMPTFVTFGDPNDPMTINILEPGDEGIGPGLQVLAATITPVEQPYVPKLEQMFKQLPWLPAAIALGGDIWGPDPMKRPIEQEVRSQEFSKEAF